MLSYVYKNYKINLKKLKKNFFFLISLHWLDK
jgi:hypothetical protein